MMKTSSWKNLVKTLIQLAGNKVAVGSKASTGSMPLSAAEADSSPWWGL